MKLPGSLAPIRTLLLLLVLLLFVPASASPVPSYFTQWLDSTVFPQKGTTISDEVKCYGLPYGVIGNVSHLLTYWTLGCIFFYKTPWWPWRTLRAGQIDLLLGLIQVLVSVGVASLTIVRCRHRWQFIILAASRLQFSLTLGYCAIHTSARIMRDRRHLYGKILSQDSLPLQGLGRRPDDAEHIIRALEERNPPPELGALPWLIHLSALPGLAALGSLIHELWQACECKSEDACTVCQNWKHGHELPIKNISYAFLGSVTILVVVLIFMVGRKRSQEKRDEGQASPLPFHFVGALIGLLLALYTDWLLATIADNLVGSPSGDLAILYWAYFGAKRLPMLFS